MHSGYIEKNKKICPKDSNVNINMELILLFY